MSPPSRPANTAMPDPDRRTFLAQTAGAMAAFAIQPTPSAPPRARRVPLGIGLVGVGRQGRAILAELQKLEACRVVALCDAMPSRTRKGLRRARGAKGHDDAAALLDDPAVQAVVVATPTHLHRAIAVTALQKGKHVYCEAPLAASVDDAKAIATAARGTERVFQSGLLARSDPIYQLARSFYRSGSLRDLLSMRAQTAEKTSWRMPAADAETERMLNWRLDPARSIGLAGELGVHQFDVLHWFTGQYPERVSGSGSVRYYRDGREVADTAQCDLVFPDDVHLSWQATLANSYGGRREVLTGSMAAIVLAWTAGWMFKEADSPTQGWEVYANRESFHNDEGITLIADATKLAKQGKLREGVGLPQPPLYYGLADFVQAATGEGEVACGAEEGLRATTVAIAAHRAVTTGKPVKIEL